MTDEYQTDRRGFMRLGALGGVAVGAAMVSGRALANGSTSGDIAILQFLCAAEQIESNPL
jgi:hypothetical protein